MKQQQQDLLASVYELLCTSFKHHHEKVVQSTSDYNNNFSFVIIHLLCDYSCGKNFACKGSLRTILVYHL